MMLDPDISPTEEVLLKKNDYVRQKMLALRKQINEYAKTIRANDKLAREANREYFFKNIQFIEYPQDKEHRKLLYGLALYGIELIKKVEAGDSAAKKEILSYMERCDKFYKEKNADMDHLPDNDIDEDIDEEEVDTENEKISEAPPNAPKPAAASVNQAESSDFDDLDVLVDDDGNILS